MNERVSFFRLDDAAPAARAAPAPVVAFKRPAPPPKPQPRPTSKQPAAAAKRVPARTHAASATALRNDPDWKEF